MDTNEAVAFSNLLHSYKHLWVKHQVFKYLTEHPDDDPESVYGRFFDEADDLCQKVANALLEGQPLQGVLQAFLQTTLPARGPKSHF